MCRMLGSMDVIEDVTWMMIIVDTSQMGDVNKDCSQHKGQGEEIADIHV